MVLFLDSRALGLGICQCKCEKKRSNLAETLAEEVFNDHILLVRGPNYIFKF